MVDRVDELESINSLEDMGKYISQLRVRASNNRDNKEILSMIDIVIEKCKIIEDLKSLVKLYEIKISQLQHSPENFSIIINLITKMKEISEKINYTGGLALAYNVEWYIEKYIGNTDASKEALDKSMYFIALEENIEEYDYYVCNYSFGVERWLTNRDEIAADILEECAYYFLNNGFFRSFTFTLGILILIYQQTQGTVKSMNLTKKFLGQNNFLRNIPEEIKSIIHYYIGCSQELSFNLSRSEEHLLVTIQLLRPVYETSIYSSFYITALSYLTATYALQGKLELAYNQILEVDILMNEGIITRNLDDFSREQMKHIFNLTKFYILSRLRNFESNSINELKQNIFENISKYYSNSIFFSEFLLNAGLTKEQLIEIRDLKTASTKRVEHIINFLIEKATKTNEQDMMNLIDELKRRPAKDRMTYVEKAFADLLAAQEYYKLRRFSEIYPILKKYKDNLNRIEVLELRIFMEVFIQIGAFKNGDPMGPALQYVAIRKCQQYGFSGLESKLLNYLELQRQDVIKTLF